MSFIFKLIVIAAGLLAIYGIVTGGDLNQLFSNAMAQALPFAKMLIANLAKFFTEAIR